MMDTFTQDEFIAWVSHAPREVRELLPRHGTWAEQTRVFIDALARRGLINTAFFESLSAALPHASATIARVSQLFNSKQSVYDTDRYIENESPPYALLVRFLEEHFDSDELKTLIRDLPDSDAYASELLLQGSLSTMVDGFVHSLERRAGIGLPLFEALASHRPNLRTQVDILRRLWLDPEIIEHRKALSAKRQSDEARRKAELAAERAAAEAKQRRERSEKVENQARLFVRESKEELRRRERVYAAIAYFCYAAGGIALVIGAWLVLQRGAKSLELVAGSDWYALVDFVIIGAIGVTFVVAASRYAFILGKAFMTEALTNSDRRHAIAFGEFYLLAYGEQAKWEELKEAFQHWNVGRGSLFSQAGPDDYDPKLVASAVEILKVLRENPGETKQNRGRSDRVKEDTSA